MRIFFIVLMASFALWGVPRDFIGQSSAVAKIGGTEISSDTFRRAFDNQLNNLSRQNGGKLDRNAALAIGLDKQVLERLVGQGALLQMADKMKLGLSDETIATGIKAVLSARAHRLAACSSLTSVESAITATSNRRP